MAETRHPESDPSQPLLSRIRVAGHLGQQWAEWFEGLTIALEEGAVTLLSGPVVDQAMLRGLLKRVRDLGIPCFRSCASKRAWHRQRWQTSKSPQVAHTEEEK